MQVLDHEAVDPKQRLSELLERPRMEGLSIERLPVKGYERVLKVTEKKSKLSAIIAIHDTTLGPSLGGVRIHPYASFDEALQDALRLAKGMTYKAAISEVGFGGAKSVIIADPKTDKTPELLRAFAEAVESLQGLYICAEDVGCTPEDCKVIRQVTQYVVGLSHNKSSGNPAPFTAFGVFRAIQATAKRLFGTDSLEGVTVAVQGLGSVGSNLVGSLFWAGAKLVVSDVDLEKANRIAASYGAAVVAPEDILFAECDIFSPCALGGVFNDQTIPRLRTKAIVGGANNQLLRDSHALELKERGILYAPDFVINAGGLLNVAAELEDGGYHPSAPREKISKIYDCLSAIYEIADNSVDSTHTAALSLAEHRIKYGIGKRVLGPTFHHEVEF